MKGKGYKIDFEIYIVFIIVISISIFNALFSTINISNNRNETSRIMTVNVPSLRALEKMNLMITRSEMYSTNLVYFQQNNDDKIMLRKIHDVDYPELKKNLTGLMQNWDKKEDVSAMQNVFREFENLILDQKKLMRLLVSKEDYSDQDKLNLAMSLVETKVLPLSGKLMNHLNRIILTKETNAKLKHADMLASSTSLMWSVTGIALLIVLVVFFAAFYMSDHMIVPTMKLRSYIVQMARGEIPFIDLKEGSNAVGQMTAAVKTLSVNFHKTTLFAHDIGEGKFDSDFKPLSDKDELGNALLQMRNSLRAAEDDNRQRTWVSSRIEKINEVLRENTDDINQLSQAIITAMVKYLNANTGKLFLLEESAQNGNSISLFGYYNLTDCPESNCIADQSDEDISEAISGGEVIYRQDVSREAGRVITMHRMIIPLKHHDKIYGAVSLCGAEAFQNYEIGFVKSISETIGSTISSVIANTITKRLLEETRLQATLLQNREEQLKTANSELSYQSELLLKSEEELKQGNISMKLKARELQQKNEILEQAREAISIKAKELELNNRYKSEFLANMSHELRTPLNSVLILAKLLSENKDRNLTIKQAEYAKVIHKSGNDLLNLINDILDLSKIEAGKVEMMPEETELNIIKSDIRSLFVEVANEKQIDFIIESHSELPELIVTDKVRLEQVIKNLLSNAFKFTPSKGQIVLRFKRPDKNVRFSNAFLRNKKNILEISVTDSGIGIPAEKQALIFEAFQQLDGSTSRKYGGTGLGLSISKMLVSMLGGEMQLISEQGSGSTFSVFVPEVYEKELLKFSVADENPGSNILPPARLQDDRNKLLVNDRLILIGETDMDFAKVLFDLAHEKKYKVILASGREEVLAFTDVYKPSAIILDENIEDASSGEVINMIRTKAEHNKIPVHIITDSTRIATARDLGATAYLRKPLDKRDLDEAFSALDKSINEKIKNVLVIEDMILHQEIVKNLLASHYKGTGVHIAKTAAEAEDFLTKMFFDCIILDLDLGNGSEEGCLLLQRIKAAESTAHVPVIVFTGTDIDSMNSETLIGLSEAIVSKDGEALDKLMKETDQFLSSIDKNTFVNPPVMPVFMNDILADKTVLLVDDDMRNIYALTNLLENHKMTVIPASNGREALEKLNRHADISIILMDIMMPEMDGYEAMQKIRQIDSYRTLPILALTAKAMVGDREKCLQCGASDYISKPVNMENLFSMMRIWLYEEINNS